MADPAPAYPGVPLSHLPTQEKARRAASFGAVASHYERYRPGPPVAAVEWVLPSRVGTVVDLGAGTGALTRLLVDRADQVVAVEPDERMRAVLASDVPGVLVLDGRGESVPVPDRSADAVLASSSWHWMDPLPTLGEMGRILVPGGTLAALWSGPDRDGPFVTQARALLEEHSAGIAEGEPPVESSGAQIAGLVMGDADRPASRLEIPAGVPFAQPEHEVFTWDIALNADELIGLLGTFSSIITMPEDTRERVFTVARGLLRDLLGVEGEVTVDVAFRAEVWRSRRRG